MLAVVCGSSGTEEVSEIVAQATNAQVISVHAIQQKLYRHALEGGESLRVGSIRLIHRATMECAKALLEQGKKVVIEASFIEEDHRKEVCALAKGLKIFPRYPFVFEVKDSQESSPWKDLKIASVLVNGSLPIETLAQRIRTLVAFNKL